MSYIQIVINEGSSGCSCLVNKVIKTKNCMTQWEIKQFYEKQLFASVYAYHVDQKPGCAEQQWADLHFSVWGSLIWKWNFIFAGRLWICLQIQWAVKVMRQTEYWSHQVCFWFKFCLMSLLLPNTFKVPPSFFSALENWVLAFYMSLSCSTWSSIYALLVKEKNVLYS